MSGLNTVYIKWIDSNGFAEGGWQNKRDLEKHKPAEIETTGFVWEDTKDYVTVVMSVDDDRNFMGCICIPKCCILERVDGEE